MRLRNKVTCKVSLTGGLRSQGKSRIGRFLIPFVLDDPADRHGATANAEWRHHTVYCSALCCWVC